MAYHEFRATGHAASVGSPTVAAVLRSSGDPTTGLHPMRPRVRTLLLEALAGLGAVLVFLVIYWWTESAML